MSRLLTLLLLYREEYIVGKYISIEMILESSNRKLKMAMIACMIGVVVGFAL